MLVHRSIPGQVPQQAPVQKGLFQPATIQEEEAQAHPLLPVPDLGTRGARGLQGSPCPSATGWFEPPALLDPRRSAERGYGEPGLKVFANEPWHGAPCVSPGEHRVLRAWRVTALLPLCWAPRALPAAPEPVAPRAAGVEDVERYGGLGSSWACSRCHLPPEREQSPCILKMLRKAYDGS